MTPPHTSRHRSPQPPRLPAWLLERVLPAPALEFVLGDLAEEYALQVETSSAIAADRWYWTQVCRSVPGLVRRAFRHAGYFRTVAVAVALYVCATTAESFAQGWLRLLTLSDAGFYLASLVAGLAAMALGGWLAACIRRPAAPLMAAIIFAVVVLLMVQSGDAAPLWYQLAFLIAGPLAPIGGGLFAVQRLRRQNR